MPKATASWAASAAHIVNTITATPPEATEPPEPTDRLEPPKPPKPPESTEPPDRPKPPGQRVPPELPEPPEPPQPPQSLEPPEPPGPPQLGATMPPPPPGATMSSVMRSANGYFGFESSSSIEEDTNDHHVVHALDALPSKGAAQRTGVEPQLGRSEALMMQQCEQAAQWKERLAPMLERVLASQERPPAGVETRSGATKE
ncbi:anther-specific proline-rich protein APG-like [Pollicipes pollicipes]|uniref:anther-specific proline-rich protein APG-like n=1 Tax=Pollicipes pollicipes TaxID=41117 RepID=UPI0018856FF4|nr:anther-specific proline-rich protein APG-like [Pollicipes pollicipes]